MTLNQLWIQATADAAHKTLSALAGLSIETKTVKGITSLEPLEGTVSALLSFEGKTVQGDVLLSFPPATFKMIVEKILQEEIIVEENYSFATEMLNMVYGGIKTAMNKEAYELGLARPELILEKKAFPSLDGRSISLIPCFIEEGKGFFIILLIKEKV